MCEVHSIVKDFDVRIRKVSTDSYGHRSKYTSVSDAIAFGQFKDNMMCVCKLNDYAMFYGNDKYCAPECCC